VTERRAFGCVYGLRLGRLVSIARYQCRTVAADRAESSVVGAVSFITVAAGATMARLSKQFPARVETLETVAGILLLSGFAAIGYALPAML
jgi:hypothetical protein